MAGRGFELIPFDGSDEAKHGFWLKGFVDADTAGFAL